MVSTEYVGKLKCLWRGQLEGLHSTVTRSCHILIILNELTVLGGSKTVFVEIVDEPEHTENFIHIMVLRYVQIRFNVNRDAMVYFLDNIPYFLVLCKVDRECVDDRFLRRVNHFILILLFHHIYQTKNPAFSGPDLIKKMYLFKVIPLDLVQVRVSASPLPQLRQSQLL